MLEAIRRAPPWRPTKPWREWAPVRDRLLHRFINEQLYPYSPFYRRLFDASKINPKFIRSTADLRHLPFTTKADIAPTLENPTRHLDLVLQPDIEKIRRFAPKSVLFKLLLAKLRAGDEAARDLVRLEYAPVHIISTTGRTALPTQFFYAWSDFQRLHLVGKRLFEVVGMRAGERALNVFPFAPHLAFWQTYAGGIAANALILHTGGGKVMGTTGNVLALQKFQPTSLIGVPGYVYHMLRQAVDQGVRLTNLKRIALGAERVPPALRERLAQLCQQVGVPDVAVLSVYGFTEARFAWGECPSGSYHLSHGFHTYPELEIFEIIDPTTGEPVGPGERGEVVYTSLQGRGSCVLRYRTGDIADGGIVCDPCPGCRRAVPRISAALSRRSDVGEFQLAKIRGTLIDLNGFIPVMAATPEVIEWQVVVKKLNDDPSELDELVLYVAVRDGVNSDALRARLADRLLGELEVAPNRIEVLPLAELEANLGLDTQLKELRIRDLRAQGRRPL